MVQNVKAKAKAALQGHWFGSIVVFLVFVLLFIALDATGIGVVFTGLLYFGYAAVSMELFKKKKVKLGAMFHGMFKGFFEKWGASLLISVYVFLWSLLLIIPGIIMSYAYSMTCYIMQENPGMSMGLAIAKSRRMMKGHKWELFLLDLSFTGWMLLSILTLGLALFYVWPYYQAARAAFYYEIKKGAQK